MPVPPPTCAPLGAQALPVLNDDVVAKMRAPVHALLAHLDRTLSADVEALSDGNRDRMFTAASQLLQKASQVLTHADGAVAADCKARPAHLRLGFSQLNIYPPCLFMHVLGYLGSTRAQSISQLPVQPVCAQVHCMWAQVAKVQREFIQRLLTFTTFSKHMAAVRETHSLLRCALDLRDRPRPPEPSDGGRCIKVRCGADASI